MTPNTPNPLLASLTLLAQGEEWRAEDLDGLGRLLKPIYKKHTGRYSPTSSGFVVPFEDALHGFVADQLLAQGEAGLRNILLNAHDDREANGRLVKMFQRFLIQDRRSVRGNKRRVVLAILQESYRKLSDKPEIWSPKGMNGPSLSEYTFLNNQDKWARDYGPVTPVLGSEESTQLPIVVRRETVADIVAFLFRRARAPLALDKIFGFVDKVADLAHWVADRHFAEIVRHKQEEKNLKVANINLPEDRLSGKLRGKNDETEAKDEKRSPEECLLREAQEKEARRFVRSLRPEQIWYVCRRLKGTPFGWADFQARFGMSRTTFFDKPFRKMKDGLQKLRASDTEVFDLALRLIAGLCSPQGHRASAIPGRQPNTPGPKR